MSLESVNVSDCIFLYITYLLYLIEAIRALDSFMHLDSSLGELVSSFMLHYFARHFFGQNSELHRRVGCSYFQRQ